MTNTAARTVALLLLSAVGMARAAGNTTSFQLVDGAFSAFWYVPSALDNSTIRLQFQVDFSLAPSGATSPTDQWVGVGFKVAGDSAGTMGPGEFYTGQANTLAVTHRWLKASSTFPPPTTGAGATDVVLESGCEVDGSKLICSVLRYVTPPTAAAATSVDVADSVQLMWAFGPLTTDLDIDFHGTNYGISNALNLLDTSPAPPSFSSGTASPLTASWMPLPADGSIDFFMEYTFDTAADAASHWIGIGLSPQAASMGPLEAYTGQGNVLSTVTSRWLAAGFDYPPPNPNPDVRSGFCSIAGATLTCTFNRPLTANATTQIGIATDLAFIKFGVGPVAGTDINQHTVAGVSSAAVNFTEVGSNLPPLPPPAKPNNALLKAHGALMIAAWLVLLPFGIYSARFKDAMGLGKKPGQQGHPMWWKIHGNIQYVGVACMTAGIVCIFVKVGWMTEAYLKNTYSKGLHEILGIVSFALSLTQPVFATLRRGVSSCSPDQQHRCHHIWHVIHGIVGYGALGCALVAVALGIEEYNLSAEWPVLFVAGYATSMGALGLFCVWGIARAVCCRSADDDDNKTRLLEAGMDGERNDNPRKTPAMFVWLLLALMLAGGTMCAVALITSTARD